MHAVLKSAFDDMSEELAHFDATSANVHPRGLLHCWTVRQVVEHLVLSMDATCKELEQRLEKGRVQRRVQRTRAEWALQLMVLSMGHMPRGVPAIPETVPATEEGTVGVRDLVAQLEAAIEKMDATFDQARQMFGMERVGRHFLLGPLRVDQWRRYHVLHLRHHLKQVADVRQTLSVEVRHSPAMASV